MERVLFWGLVEKRVKVGLNDPKAPNCVHGRKQFFYSRNDDYSLGTCSPERCLRPFGNQKRLRGSRLLGLYDS